MKRFSIKLVCFILIFSFSEIISFAENPFPQELIDFKNQQMSTLQNTPFNECKNKISTIYDIELLQFFNFLEENFRNKSANTSLIDNAITKYIDYRNTLKSTFLLLNPSSSAVSQEYLEALTEYKVCQGITDLYISKARDMMMQHINKTSAQKKASIFVEKFKGIDSKMRDFNLEISQMYGYMTVFKNKLPGFLKQCVVQ